MKPQFVTTVFLTFLHIQGCGSGESGFASAANGPSPIAPAAQNSAEQGQATKVIEVASQRTVESESTPATTRNSAPITATSTAPGTTSDTTPESTPEPAQETAPDSSLASGLPAPSNPLLSRAIKILALGDSMTAGDEHDPSSFKSYRGALYHLLVGQGYSVDFVGTQYSLPAVGGDPEHDGYGGAYIGPGGAANNLTDRLPTILASSNPDIIILAFGWNSVFNETSVAGAKYRDIVNRIASAKPQAHLVLATLSPMRGHDETTGTANLRGYRDLNSTARTMAGDSQSDRIHLADFASGGFRFAEYWDTIHWLQPGADRAARILFEAFRTGPLARTAG